MARFVAEECLFLRDFYRKKFLIAEVGQTFLRQSCTEARTQDSDRKQEFDSKEAERGCEEERKRSERVRPALGKEAKHSDSWAKERM